MKNEGKGCEGSKTAVWICTPGSRHIRIPCLVQ